MQGRTSLKLCLAVQPSQDFENRVRQSAALEDTVVTASRSLQQVRPPSQLFFSMRQA